MAARLGLLGHDEPSDHAHRHRYHTNTNERNEAREDSGIVSGGAWYVDEMRAAGSAPEEGKRSKLEVLPTVTDVPATSRDRSKVSVPDRGEGGDCKVQPVQQRPILLVNGKQGLCKVRSVYTGVASFLRLSLFPPPQPRPFLLYRCLFFSPMPWSLAIT